MEEDPLFTTPQRAERLDGARPGSVLRTKKGPDSIWEFAEYDGAVRRIKDETRCVQNHRRHGIEDLFAAPLGADLQVTGHPTINLWVSSSATDGDFIATIQDVAPDGTAASYNVSGRIRASLRKLEKAPYNNLGLPWHRFNEADAVPLVPGEPVELVFEILPTSMVFKAGHRIRLVIDFADARSTPRLDPAPKVSIYRDSRRQSYVTLPIIEAR